MEHYKMPNNSTVSNFVTKNGLSSGQYSLNQNISFKISMLKSDLCDYSHAYIVLKRRITVKGDNDVKTSNKKLTFKNNAPFTSYISKISIIFTDNAEDLDIVLPMYNLLEYSSNYFMTSENLRNYYRNEINDDVNENDVDNNDNRINKKNHCK